MQIYRKNPLPNPPPRGGLKNFCIFLKVSPFRGDLEGVSYI